MFGENWIKWLIGDMGTPGEYMYQPIHLYTVLVVAIITAVFLLWQRFLTAPGRRKLLVGVCIVQLAFEVAWRLIYLFVKKCAPVELWPSYPCNLGGILLPVIALVNWKRGKQLFYLFGFVGAILTFAMPDGIFCTDVFVFPLLKSVMQHTGILIIPLMEYAGKSYRCSVKDLGWVILGCLVHVLNCEFIVRLMGLTGDYMFFRSGMPFVIPGVPQYITLSVFALIVLFVLSFLSDIKGSLAFLRSFKKQKVSQ